MTDTPTNAPVSEACENTDRELWREKSVFPADPDNYYAPSIHVTAQGCIGINVGGTVMVRPLREWFAAMQSAASPVGDEVREVHDRLRAWSNDPDDEPPVKLMQAAADLLSRLGSDT